MKSLLAAAGAAAAGAALLAVLVPRLDPTAAVRSRLDRQGAIARARALALRYGVDTAGWSASVWDQASGKDRAYLAAHPGDPPGRLFEPLTITVVLREPNTSRRATLVLFPDGRPTEWRWEAGGGPPAKPPAVPIDEVLKDFVGPRLSSFAPPSTSTHEGVVHRRWEWAGPPPSLLTATLDAEEKDGALQAVNLAPVYADPFNRQYSPGLLPSLAERVGRWARGLFLIPAMLFCIWHVARGRFQFRIPVFLLLAQLAWALASLWGSTYFAQLRDMWPGGGRNLNINPGLANYGWSPWAAIAFLCLFLFAGAGRVMRVAANGEKWFTLDLLARGRLRNRAVGRSLALGLSAGVAMAALPYAVAALSRIPLPFHSVDALVAPVSLTVAVRLSALVLPLELFGFLFPWSGYLPKPVLRWAVFLPVAVLVASAAGPPGALPALLTAALLVAGYGLLYFHADLLAAMAAALAARFVVVPAVLLCQASGALRESAVLLFGIGIAVLASAVHTALRAPERDPLADGVPAGIPLGPDESDRERLAAEFEVARKAQQAALPDAPPAIAGYSLAASCEPAQQVGGDLYDFFHLPDGRLGITVADVSGKGVPAALYMMVTKGLLAAVSRDSAELPHILQQLNLQLYRACRRRVFVTMAAVALDGPRRRLQYGRAGHNPLVWRRAARRETLLVKPRGLGLGMTPADPFQRNLDVDELQLEPGDAIVLYSDGVTEAVNQSMDQYGETRLLERIGQTDGQTAPATRDAILGDLSRFMGAAPARDDITVVVLRVEHLPAEGVAAHPPAVP